MRDLIVFGTSSSEVFDYIFGNNPKYHSFWASGWSARGLRGLKNSDKLLKPYIPYLDKIPKQSNILLCFGDVDIDFNLPYKMYMENFYDIPTFLDEMKEGILELKFALERMGFKNIFSIFVVAPRDLSDSYWQYPSLPLKLRGNLYLDYAAEISKVMKTINCIPSLIRGIDNPVLSESFCRENSDHHIDYVKAQNIIYQHLSNQVEQLLEHRNPPHTELYKHQPMHLNTVLIRNMPRPRTAC